jgi:hypothetical protein
MSTAGAVLFGVSLGFAGVCASSGDGAGFGLARLATFVLAGTGASSAGLPACSIQ